MAVLKYKDPNTGEVKVVFGGGGANTGGHEIGDICCSTKDDLGSSWKLTNGETTIFKDRSPELIEILNKNDEWGSKIISFNNSTTNDDVETTKIIYCENKLVALLSNCHICVASEPGDDWIDLGDIRSSEFGVVLDIAYHDGIWVAVGEIDDDGDDGNYDMKQCLWVTNNLNGTWILVKPESYGAWGGLNKIFYLNNMWVATSYNNMQNEQLYVSTDPFNTWIGPINPGFTKSLNLTDLIYENGMWIGTGIAGAGGTDIDEYPYIAITTDIINGTWTQYEIANVEVSDLTNLLYHNGMWVVGATQSNNAHFCLFYTTDITTEWTRYDVTNSGKIDSDFRLHDICYYNNKWTICGYYSRDMLPCDILTASELTGVWASLGSFSSEISPFRPGGFNYSWLEKMLIYNNKLIAFGATNYNNGGSHNQYPVVASDTFCNTPVISLNDDINTFIKISDEVNANTVDLANYISYSTFNTEINSLKTSVSEGKSLIAEAVTDKGVPTASDATFATMAENINNIKNSKSKILLGTFTIPASESFYNFTLPKNIDQYEKLMFSINAEWTVTSEAFWMKMIRGYISTGNETAYDATKILAETRSFGIVGPEDGGTLTQSHVYNTDVYFKNIEWGGITYSMYINGTSDNIITSEGMHLCNTTVNDNLNTNTLTFHGYPGNGAETGATYTRNSCFLTVYGIEK